VKALKLALGSVFGLCFKVTAGRHGPREGYTTWRRVKALKGWNPMGVTGMKYCRKVAEK
jgi:hypothetical protein